MHSGHGRRGKKPGRGAAPQTVLSVGSVPPGTFAVIDPGSKTLFIPIESMQDTRAIHREGVPSLCRIFLEGRCRQGTNCYQAHADPAVIMHLRAAALAEPTCCKRHGARSDETGIPEGVVILLKNDDGDIVHRVGLQDLCVTNGLRALAGAQNVSSQPWVGSELVVPMSSLCRLHAGKEGSPCCRFEDKCNFIHLCREALPAAASETQSARAARADARPPPVQLPQPENSGGYTTNGATSSSTGGSPAMPSFGAPQTPINTSHCVRPLVTVPLSSSAMAGGTPPIRFDPMALAATAPTGPDGTVPMAMSPTMVRSFSSTPSGLVWRHNPYGSSRTSSVVET